jgi:hypothetical protein
MYKDTNVSTGPNVSIFRAKGEGGMFLPNTDISLQDYTASDPRRAKSKINTYIHTYVHTYIHTYIHTSSETVRTN